MNSKESCAQGAIAALVTPFRNGKIDGAALDELVEWQVLSGVDGLALCAAAGEGSTLSRRERRMVLDICIQAAADRIPVIAGAIMAFAGLVQMSFRLISH